MPGPVQPSNRRSAEKHYALRWSTDRSGALTNAVSLAEEQLVARLLRLCDVVNSCSFLSMDWPPPPKRILHWETRPSSRYVLAVSRWPSTGRLSILLVAFHALL